jgi:hypothetical protein
MTLDAARYPVHYLIERPPSLSRLQLAMRVVAFLALGLLGISFGAVFFVAYLALPVVAAARLSAGREPSAYVSQDGERVFAALRWVAAVSAWAALLSDRLPWTSPDETVRVSFAGSGRPNARSALSRVVTGLPSALALMIVGWFGALVWLWAALSVLVSERVGLGAFNYLVGVQRWSIRLLAYQASLVDEYPPFSFADAPPGLIAPPLAAAPHS